MMYLSLGTYYSSSGRSVRAIYKMVIILYSFLKSRLSPPGTPLSPIQAYLRDLHIPLIRLSNKRMGEMRISSIDFTLPLILLMELKRKELTRTLIMNLIQILLIPSFVANTKIRLSLLPLIHQILLLQYIIELILLLFGGTAILYRVPYPAPTALASSPAPASLTTPYILNYSIHP